MIHGLAAFITSIVFYPPIWQVLIVGFILSMLTVMFNIWFERKAAARVQRRVGPLWASPRLGGLMHVMADFIRYVFQQVIVPSTVDRRPFILAPIVGLVIVIVPIAAVPLTSVESYWVIPYMDYSLLLALALTTIPPVFIILASWASNNKFAVIGGVREAFIITAYELIAIVAILSAAAMTLSFNMVEIVEVQQPVKWFILLNPLAFIAAFVGVMMSTSAFPFEIPESESEVVAGPFTEYSGVLYALNMGGAYIRRYIYSIIMAIVFLGGWAPLEPSGGVLAGYLLPTVIVLAKAVILMLAMSFLRAVYGRYRLDQALEAAWRLILPLTLTAFGLGLVEAYLGII